MNLTSLLYSSSVFALLCGNLIYISVSYFQYAIDTNVSPFFPVHLRIPSFSLCYWITSLLSSEDDNYNSALQHYSFLGLTVKQVFNRVPKANDSLKSCKFRDFEKDVLIQVSDGRQCNQLFNMSRYIMQGFVCYRYIPNPRTQYSFHALVNSMYEPRELFHLTINSPLSEKQIIYPIIHLADLPRENRVFNQEEFTEIHSMHYISYNQYESYSLPAPYESRCSQVPPMKCFQNCVDYYFRRLNFISDSTLVLEGSRDENLAIPTEDADLGDIESVQRRCHRKCDFQACYFSLIQTNTGPGYPSEEKFSLVIETLSSPTLKVIHGPRFGFFDFITQVASVIGIWLGISVVSLTSLLRSNQYKRMTDIYSKMKFHSHLIDQINSSIIQKGINSGYLIHPFMQRRQSTKATRAVTCARAASILHFLIFDCLSKALVLLLFSWQLFNVLRTYFLYRTTIKFDYDVNPSLIMPSLCLCYPFENLYNVPISDEMTEENYDHHFKMIDSAVDFTVEEIFNQFDDRDVISACNMRNWTDRFDRLILLNQSECLEKFRVVKFTASRELCFGVIPRKRFYSYPVSDVRLSADKPGMVFGLASGFKLQSVAKVHVYLYFADGPPQPASKYVTFYRTDQHRIIRLSNRLFSVTFLEPPYDTNCNPAGRKKCYEGCMAKQSQGIDKLFYSLRISEPLPQKILSYSDFLNRSVYNITRDAELMCEKTCAFDGCTLNFTSTYSDGDIYFNGSDTEPRVIYAAQTVAFPNSKVVAIPVQRFYDLFYQMLCCFSFWLGFSFFSLNPVSWMEQKKAKEASQYLIDQLKLLQEKLALFHMTTHDTFISRLHHRWKRYNKKSLIIVILSSIGCIYHSWYSFAIYFNYSALIDVQQKTDTDTQMFPLICLDLAQLLTRTHDPVHFSNLSDPMFKAQVLDRTISSLLADTPSGEEVMQSCQYWGTFARQGQVTQMAQLTDRILFETRNQSICNEIYHISKFISNNYMCYAARPRNYTEWTSRRMMNALRDAKTLMKMTVKSSFLTPKFSVLINRLQYLPFSSSTWTPNLRHVPQYNRYHISYVRYVQSLLPSPWVRDGFVPFIFDRCNNACINNKFAPFNLTLSRRFTGPSDFKFLTYSHRIGEVMPTIINSIVSSCEKRCAVFNDHVKEEGNNDLTLFIPTVRPLNMKTDHEDEVTFTFRTTNSPMILVFFKLKISFFEQLINFGSVIGIWFGVSMMHLARYTSGGISGDDLEDSHSIEMSLRQLERVCSHRLPTQITANFQ